MYTLVGFGNPLLDICLNINNNDLLIKYDLRPDDQKQITKDEMKELLDDITGQRFDISYSPGGCAQNTIRLFQSLQNQPQSTCIVGAIGSDDQGANLQSLVEHNGVITKYINLVDKHASLKKTTTSRYTQISNEPTGTSVALIFGSKRSLVAYLGAAECLSDENITYDVSDLICNGQVFYMEGFFLTKRVPLASKILAEVTKQNKTFAFNISARYLCEGRYHSIVENIARECTVLFGNLREFECLLLANDFKGTLRDYLKYLYCKEREAKVIVVTNGANPVLLLSNGTFVDYPVPLLDEKLIKDTTGAGDAFVAGFLYAYLKQQTMEMCVEFGCAVAREVIQNIGCFMRKNESDVILQKYAHVFTTSTY